MSSYSFSHQFYQRWTCAPDPIRASIIQELTDISTLLQHDTPFETFVFSTHDLDAHLDELYENHEAEQAIAKAIADKQAQQQAAAEKQRLEEEQRLEKEKEKEKQAKAVDTKRKEEERLKAAEAAQKQQQQPEQLDTDKDNGASETEKSNAASHAEENQAAEKSDTTNANMDKKAIHEPSNAANGANDNNIKTVIDKAVSDAAIHLSLKDTKLGATHPDLIRELEMHVDDYLSEQMMQISENLKSWLRAELAQHLTEPDMTRADDHKENTAKKNIH
ncbi:hypothetical protein [Psychrobacter sp. UBA5136]|uniref:hypothetical protein n=1 Tax=Psychrobacter sp. UBA5136 TaxID=1947356 RepID=UPI0025E6D3DA|nr:hypothetical protein [Psychrobacter sp. UBA5136]